MKFVVVGMLITIAVITAACSGSESPSQAPSPSAQTPAATPPPGNMKEIGKKEAAGYVITLSSESGSLKQGSNNLTLEFRKGDQLADPGKVRWLGLGIHDHVFGRGDGIRHIHTMRRDL